MRDLAKVVNLRTGMASVVVGVAGVAAVQSFSHIYWLARTHGGNELDSILLPLSVDGLIVAMTLLLLEQVRQHKAPPWLAYGMLWLGILATVGANIIYGIRWGIVGSVVSAWPAAAFIGAVHVVTEVARTWSLQVSDPAEVADPVEAAREALAASVAAGNPLSIRKLAGQFGIGRPKAKSLVTELTEGTATA